MLCALSIGPALPPMNPTDADVAVVTGTTHGIGMVTARELARAGRHVVMLVRDARAGERVAGDISRSVPDRRPDVIHCDLASLDSVRTAAAQVCQRYPRLHLLVNNAGAVSMSHRLSADGFELTFATNHLGPFLLTALLGKCLVPGARIVNVASRIHRRGRMDLDSVPDLRATYRSRDAYARSKLANVMHTFALARRLEGGSVTANCLHPGVISSHLLPRWLRLVKPLISPGMIDCEQGARTSLHLALSPDVAGTNGRYFDEHQVEQAASAAANDVEMQELLWRRSEEWVEHPGWHVSECSDAPGSPPVPAQGRSDERT